MFDPHALWRAGLSVLALSATSAAVSTNLLDDDFSAGLGGWSTSGSASLNTAYYHSAPQSVYFTGQGSITRSFSTAGYHNIQLQLYLRAYSLDDPQERCVVQVNNGTGWQTATALEDGDDDGSWLQRRVNIASLASDQSTVQLRFIAAAANDSGGYWGDNDYCYVDDVLVTGEPASHSRVHLAFNQLTNGSGPGALVGYAAFAPAADAAAPLAMTPLNGELVLANPADASVTDGAIADGVDTLDYAAVDDTFFLPDMAIRLVQDGDTVIPVDRGIRASDHRFWEYIVEPGRIWSEPGDNGYNRVALPFALMEKNQNCTFNGVMTFLYRHDGQSASISDVAYQIAQETCHYLHLDLWGQLGASLQFGSVDASTATAAIDAHTAHTASRLPVVPMSDMASDLASKGYSGNIDALSFAVAAIDNRSVYGLYVEHDDGSGTHYRSACDTRQGPFPFCESLRLPSFSTAKSAFAATALMNLERRLGGSVMQRTVASLVDAADTDGDWYDVTLNHTVDMSTGSMLYTYFTPWYNCGAPDDCTYASDETYYADDFFTAETHTDKMDAALGYTRYENPGEYFVYHTSDTYVLTAALQSLMDEQGITGDVFDTLVVDDIWAPLAVNPGSMFTRRASGSNQPFGGYGLSFTPDDVVKIARFYDILDGEIAGNTVLDAQSLSAALQQDSSDRGMFVDPEPLFYNNGFWGLIRSNQTFYGEQGDAYSPNNSLAGNCNTIVPFMSGVSGITLALLPNDTVFYSFSDGETFAWSQAVDEAHKLRGMCD